MKKCTVCKVEKLESNYSKRSPNKDGLENKCKNCYNEIITNRRNNNPQSKEITYKKEKEIYNHLKNKINNIKSIYGCYFCKENCGNCLEFHHLDSSNKLAGVGDLVRTKNISKIKSEIKKCIIVCANCHRKIHVNLISVDSNMIQDYNLFDDLKIDYTLFTHLSVKRKCD